MIGGILITHTHTHTHTPYNTYPQILIQVVDGDWDVTASRLHTHTGRKVSIAHSLYRVITLS